MAAHAAAQRTYLNDHVDADLMFIWAESGMNLQTQFDLATALDLGSCTINNRAATVAAAGSLSAGLSVSHDSVFGLDISSPESDAYFTHHHRNQPAAESLPSSASFQYMVNKIKYLNE